MENPLEAISKSFFLAFFVSAGSWNHERRQKRRLKRMLADRRFPEGFRSTSQLAAGIGADQDTAQRLLLAIGARKSETSEEWTMRAPPSK